MIGASQFSIRANGATFWRSSMIATVAPPPSSPVRSLLNIGTTLSATQPSATPSWIASFTTLTVCNSPEKACESRTPAIKLLTPTQTPEPITHVGQSRCSPSRETAAHDRLKSPLTIAEIRRLEPRGGPAERHHGDGEGCPCPALSQPHAVRAGLSAGDAGDGVRRPRPGVRPVQGHLQAPRASEGGMRRPPFFSLPRHQDARITPRYQ